MPRGPRITTLLALFAGGVLLGLVGGVVVSARAGVGDRDVPWGLVLAVAAVGCCTRAAAWLVGTRRGAVVVLLGWIVASLAFSAVNPGGDVVLPDTTASYVYLGSSVVLGLLGCLWPLPRGAGEAAYPPRREAEDALSATGPGAGADDGAAPVVD